jgi:hypothetical protein
MPSGGEARLWIFEKLIAARQNEFALDLRHPSFRNGALVCAKISTDFFLLFGGGEL